MFRVPKGEAILIVFPDNTAWLVDGGNTNKESDNIDLAKALQTYLESRPLLTLEVCVASHSHMDHIGALETLLASGSSALAPQVTVYRATGAWHRQAKFLDRYHQMVRDQNGVVEKIFAEQTEEIVPIANHAEAHFFGDGHWPRTNTSEAYTGTPASSFRDNWSRSRRMAVWTVGSVPLLLAIR